MRISVRFFTTLREITGKREETLEFENYRKVALKTILEELAKRYGKDFVSYIYDGKTGEVKGFLQFLINGKSSSPTNGLDIELANGDILAIIPPIAGG
ncbi:MoaD family protein [Candidatus Bathyarchaeota archaeon]|nr:MoaD family protein [Candidatus Bathyarchaeota archaeon]